MAFSYLDELIKADADSILGVSTPKRGRGRPKIEYNPVGEYSSVSKDELEPQHRSADGMPEYDQVERSKAYTDKANYERRNKINILTEQAYGEVGTRQYEDTTKYTDTGILERGLNYIDDLFDDDNAVARTKKEKQEALEDNNIEVWNGKRVTTKNKTRNSLSVDDIRARVENISEDPEADTVLYYSRIDNPDGTVSYKAGTANVDTYERIKNNKRRNDVTYLYAVRSNEAEEVEKLINGNESLLSNRRFDLGRDSEKYGSGYTEIINQDFLSMDGTVSADKLKTLNMSSQRKLQELGFDVQGRYDERGNDLAYKELDKIEAIYGQNSDEYKEFSSTLSNVQQVGKHKELGYIEKAGDLVDAVESGGIQLAAGVGDFVLDAVVKGDSTLLNRYKDPAIVDKITGYRGRDESNRFGSLALRAWKKGNYLGAVLQGIQASPDVLAQSIPDMALLFYSGGLSALTKAEKIARATGLLNNVKNLGQITKNRGLLLFAGKQTNNQIDDRLANGEEDVGYATISAMFASNYVLGGLDKLALKHEIGLAKELKKIIPTLPESQLLSVGTKIATLGKTMLASGTTEAGQEFLQSYGEAINSAYGTKDVKDDFFSERFLDQATKGALLGFGAGGLTPVTISPAVGIASAIKQKVDDAGITENLEKAVNKAKEAGAKPTLKENAATAMAVIKKTGATFKKLGEVADDIIKSNSPELKEQYDGAIDDVVENLSKEDLDVKGTFNSRALVDVIKTLKKYPQQTNSTFVKNLNKISNELGIATDILPSIIKQSDSNSKLDGFVDSFLDLTAKNGDGKKRTEIANMLLEFNAYAKETRAELAALKQSDPETTFKYTESLLRLESDAAKLPKFSKFVSSVHKSIVAGNKAKAEAKPITDNLDTSVEEKAKDYKTGEGNIVKNEVPKAKPKASVEPKSTGEKEVTPTAPKRIEVSKLIKDYIFKQDRKGYKGTDVVMVDGVARKYSDLNKDEREGKSVVAIAKTGDTSSREYTDITDEVISTFKAIYPRMAKKYNLSDKSIPTIGTIQKTVGKADGSWKGRVGVINRTLEAVMEDLALSGNPDFETEFNDTTTVTSSVKPVDFNESQTNTTPVNDTVIPEDTVVEDTSTIGDYNVPLKTLLNSYITKKLKGRIKNNRSFQLVFQIVEPIKELETKLQGINFITVLKSSNTNAQEVLGRLAKESTATVNALFTADTLNSNFVIEQSPMMQLLYLVNPKTKKYAINRTAAFAMYTAGLDYFAGNQNYLAAFKTKQDTARMLGYKYEDELDGETYNKFKDKGMFMTDAASDIGNATLKHLGYKPNKNSTQEDYQRLASELGTTALLMLQDKGIVEVTALEAADISESINSNEATGNIGSRTLMVVNTARGVEANNILSEVSRDLDVVAETFELGVDYGSNTPQLEPVKSTETMKIHSSDTQGNVPKDLVDTVNKIRKTEFTADTDNINWIDSNLELAKKYLGYIDPNSETYLKSSYDAQINIQGKNDEVELSLSFMTNEETSQKSTILDYTNPETGKVSMFFDYFISKNLRFFMKSSGINPQTNTLHRFLVYAKGNLLTYNKDNESDMFAFKYAVAQGFGFKVDGAANTKNSIVAKFDDLVGIGSKTLETELTEDLVEVHNLGHYLNALTALKAYEQSEKDNKSSFDSNAMLEIDHKTNGFAHKLMQYPVFSNSKLLEKSLKQVGITYGTNSADTIGNNELDAYETNADVFKEELVTNPDVTKAGRHVEQFVNAMHENSLFTFVKDGNVTKELRNIMKPLFMVFNYSAGIDSIQRTLVSTLSESMLNDLVVNDEETNNLEFLRYLQVNLDTKAHDGGKIRELIRSMPSNKINLLINGQRTTLAAMLNQSYKAVYGKALKISFSKYNEIKDYNTLTNIAVKGMFEPFIQQFKKDYGSGKTKEWVDDWLERNQNLIPNIGTSHKDSVPMAIIDIKKSSYRGNSHKEYVAKTLTTFRASIQIVKGADTQKSITSNAIVKEFISAISSGSVLPTHAVDGHNMSKTLDSFPTALGVHDAYVLGAKNLTTVAKAANRNFYDIHKNYSMFEATVESYYKIFSRKNTNKNTMITVGKGAAVKLFGKKKGTEEVNLSDIMRVLNNKLGTLKIARADLLSKDLTLENLISTNDGAYKTRADSTGELDFDEYGARGINKNLNQSLMDFGFDELTPAEKDAVVEETIEEFNGDIKSILPPTVRGGYSKLDAGTWEVVSAFMPVNSSTIKLKLRKGTTYTSVEIDRSATTAYPSERGGRKFKLVQPLLDNDSYTRDRLYSLSSEYGSRDTTNVEIDEDTKLHENLNTDPQAIVDMVESLNEQTDNFTEQEVIDNLKAVLGEFDADFLRDVALHISSTSKETTGSFNKRTGKVNLHKSRIEDNYYNQQDLPVVYAHEMIHAFTVYALEVKNNVDNSKIKRKLDTVFRQAAKVVTVEDFINDKNPNKVKAREEAEEDYRYVFANKDGKGLAEFIAYGMTNTKIIKKLKSKRLKEAKDNQNLFQKLIDLVIKALAIVTGTATYSDYTAPLHDNLTGLTLALSETNQKAITKKEKKFNSLRVLLTLSNKELANLISKIKDKVVSSGFDEDGVVVFPAKKENANRVERMIWIAKVMGLSFTNPELKGQLSSFLSEIFHIKETGMLQNFMRSIGTPEEGGIERKIASLLAIADTVDNNKRRRAEQTTNTIHSEYTEKLTPKKDQAILDVMIDLDLVSLEDSYSYDEMKQLVSDSTYRNNQIKALEQFINDNTGNSTWVKNQARGLGYYMATHAVYTDGQNLNAHNIQQGLLLNNKPLRTDLESQIDALATLYGMKYTLNDSLNTAAKLMEDKKGTTNVLANMRLIKKDSLANNFDGNKTSMVKGYAVELSDNSIEVIIRPISESKKLKAEGYKLKRKVSGNDITSTGDMGVFVSADYTNNKYVRGSTILGNLMSKGTKLSNILSINGEYDTRSYKLALARANLRFTKSKKLMTTTDIFPEHIDGDAVKDTSLLPILDHTGGVKEFRYIMSKAVKRDILKQNLRGSKVVGSTLSSISNKVDRKEHNRDVQKVIAKDMAKNYNAGDLEINNNDYRYVQVGSKADNKDGQDIYHLLPDDMKLFINSYPDGYVAVRADMLHNYFGFRVLSIAGTKFFSDSSVSPEAKKMFRLTAKIWEDVVDIAKTTITIKTPAVFTSNVGSNTLQLVQQGNDPVEVLKVLAEMTVAAKKYMDDNRELLEITLKIKTGVATNKEKAKARRLKEALVLNADVHELVEAGFFTNIVEEVVVGNDADINPNIVSQFFDDQTSKLPRVMKVGLDTLFVTKDTDLYKDVEFGIQLSDFVARLTANHFYKQKGISKSKRHNRLRDDFVHYPDLYSPKEEYLNRLGAIMFTKYLKGVLRTLSHLTTEKPLYVLMSILGQNMLGDVDDVTDKYPLANSYSSIGNNPIDIAETGATPAWLATVL